MRACAESISLHAREQVQCKIFSTTFNPEGLRTGNKILRQRLKGASVAAYYPRKVATFKDLMKRFPDMESWDDAEEDRLEHVTMYGQPGTIVRRQMLISYTVSRDAERGHQRRRSLPTVSTEHHEDNVEVRV